MYVYLSEKDIKGKGEKGGIKHSQSLVHYSNDYNRPGPKPGSPGIQPRYTPMSGGTQLFELTTTSSQSLHGLCWWFPGETQPQTQLLFVAASLRHVLPWDPSKVSLVLPSVGINSHIHQPLSKQIFLLLNRNLHLCHWILRFESIINVETHGHGTWGLRETQPGLQNIGFK